MVLVVGVLTTVAVLASGTYDVNSSIKVQYKAAAIQGGASATYTVGSTTTSMTTTGTSSGDAKISFAHGDAQTTYTLIPQTTKLTLEEGSSIVFAYTFYNQGSIYYATLDMSDLTSNASLSFSYSYDNSTYTTTGFTNAPIQAGSTASEASTTLYIKVGLASTEEDVSCSGNISWTLLAHALVS